MTQVVLKAVQAFDRHCLREMLRMKKHESMTWVVFRQKKNRILRQTLGHMGKVELAAQVLSKQYSGAGHVARMEAIHIAAQWAHTFSLESWKLGAPTRTR